MLTYIFPITLIIDAINVYSDEEEILDYSSSGSNNSFYYNNYESTEGNGNLIVLIISNFINLTNCLNDLNKMTTHSYLHVNKLIIVYIL